jgi:hypothetical protein
VLIGTPGFASSGRVVNEKALPGVATYPELCTAPGGFVDTTPAGVPAPVATTAGPAAGVPVALIGVARTDALAPAPGLTIVCVLSGSPAPMAMGVGMGVVTGWTAGAGAALAASLSEP